MQTTLATYEPVPRVSVILPARNEARNLPQALAVPPAGIHKVALVDGHSRDESVKFSRQCWPDAKIVQQIRRVARAGVRVTEVGSKENPRKNEVINLKAIPDGIRVSRAILAEFHRFGLINHGVVTGRPKPDARLIGEST